jgi:hypothetical protein
VLTVSLWTPRPSSWTPRGEPERDGGAGQMEAGRANERRRSLAYGERHGDHRAGRRATARPRLRSCPRKKGRAVLRGRPLRGPPCKYTDLFDRPRDRPHYVVPPHQGLPGSGRWRQLFGACVMALSGL